MLDQIGLGGGADFEDDQGQRTGHRLVSQTAVISVSESATIPSSADLRLRPFLLYPVSQ
jgi:hypothetical protein